MKSVKKVSKVEEDNILKSKRSLIIFDYYGIASTSGSDSPESDNFFKKDWRIVDYFNTWWYIQYNLTLKIII